MQSSSAIVFFLVNEEEEEKDSEKDNGRLTLAEVSPTFRCTVQMQAMFILFYFPLNLSVVEWKLIHN